MESIEMGYRHIGTQMGKEFHHKFLIYTNQSGQQFTISGWTDDVNTSDALPFGNIRVLANRLFDQTNPDYPIPDGYGNIQKQYRELIKQDNDLSKTWQDLVNIAQQQDNIYPYDPLVQNSNTLADNILRAVGLSQPIQDSWGKNWAPASDRPFNQNLEPKNPQQENKSNNIRRLLSADIKDLSDDEHMQNYQAARAKLLAARPDFAEYSAADQLDIINKIYEKQGKSIEYVASAEILNQLDQQQVQSQSQTPSSIPYLSAEMKQTLDREAVEANRLSQKDGMKTRSL